MVWYEAEHARLAAVLVGLAGEVDVARDVVDEAFARAWLHWGRVRQMQRPGGWLYRTALNELRRRRRRNLLEQRVLQAEVPPPPAGLGAAVEVWELVAALPPRQRACVVLRYMADLDESSIAETLGVTRSTVSSALTAARRNLGMVLAEDTAEVNRD